MHQRVGLAGRENRRIVRDEISVEAIPDGELRQQLN